MKEMEESHVEQEALARTRPLSAKEVNWSLYGKEEDAEYVKSQLGTEGLGDLGREIVEFRKDTPGGKSLTAIANVDTNRELHDFLHQHRPERLFFNPDDIASLITPESDIVVEIEENPHFKGWHFKLNPQKFPDEKSQREKLLVFRGDPDEFEKVYYLHKLIPYVEIAFVAGYDHDGEEVVYRPVIARYGKSDHIYHGLEEKLISLLGVKEKRVKQKLVFKLREPKFEERRERGYFLENPVVQIRLAQEEIPEPQEEKPKGLLSRIFRRKR